MCGLDAAVDGRVVLRDSERKAWLVFEHPRRVVTAFSVADVATALKDVEAGVNSDGLHAAGFVAYEAAPAFDSALTVRPDQGFPLVWFGLYDKPAVAESLPPAAPIQHLTWTPTTSREAYVTALSRIRSYLQSGDTYQVNFSLRMQASLEFDAWEFFRSWAGNGAWPEAAYVDAGRWAICSASPELFFESEGDLLRSRPMKGTCARGVTNERDIRDAEQLRESPKNRAENVMIVDMVRNDLGRIARPDSVVVESLFNVERYPSVWQMTSSVACRTDATLSAVLRALFPPASVTGAPKARTMEIIAELETLPRRIYTGCIGHLGPGNRARFNVAIRTVIADREQRVAEYGVGGGIVWDSDPESEWLECQTKARVLTDPLPEFRLLETILWKPGSGYYLREPHLARLGGSAKRFDFTVDLDRIRGELERAAAGFSGCFRVRLLVDWKGDVQIESSPLHAFVSPPTLRACLAQRSVSSLDPFLSHKTTYRAVYEARRAESPGYDEVLLWNERGEITEFTVGNVVVEIEGRSFTPPVSCGLLDGTLRSELVRTGQVHERVLFRDDLRNALHVWLVNSVRGWQSVDLYLPSEVPAGEEML
jgi:para-aminobenzoate synthetase / 4-amino-4-deoxychorismate lyase